MLKWIQIAASIDGSSAKRHKTIPLDPDYQAFQLGMERILRDVTMLSADERTAFLALFYTELAHVVIDFRIALALIISRLERPQTQTEGARTIEEFLTVFRSLAEL